MMTTDNVCMRVDSLRSLRRGVSITWANLRRKRTEVNNECVGRILSRLAILASLLAISNAYSQEDSFDVRLEMVLHDVCSVAAKIYTVRTSETEELRKEDTEFFYSWLRGTSFMHWQRGSGGDTYNSIERAIHILIADKALSYEQMHRFYEYTCVPFAERIGMHGAFDQEQQ